MYDGRDCWGMLPLLLVGLLRVGHRIAPLGQGASAHRAVNNTEGILRDLRRRNSGKSGPEIQGCGEPPI